MVITLPSTPLSISSLILTTGGKYLEGEVEATIDEEVEEPGGTRYLGDDGRGTRYLST